MKSNVKTQEITLPENIKKEIKDNVIELKKLLKDDQEFLQKLIVGIYSIDGIFVKASIYEHYEDVINEYEKQYKLRPDIIKRVDNLTYSLYTLAEIDNKLFQDNFKGIDEQSRKILDKIIRDEIILQFNPIGDVNYKYDFNVDTYHILGELPSDTEYKEFE